MVSFLFATVPAIRFQFAYDYEVYGTAHTHDLVRDRTEQLFPPAGVRRMSNNVPGHIVLLGIADDLISDRDTES